MESAGSSVKLYVYDLTKGMARLMSGSLLGTQIDGVWHTGVVVYGREYYYGGQGIQSCPPGQTVLGEPGEKLSLGETYIPVAVFNEYISGLRDGTFKGSAYNLLNHNCNNFSDDLSQFLCGTGIPKYILDFPQEVLNTPIGQAFLPLIQELGGNVGQDS